MPMWLPEAASKALSRCVNRIAAMAVIGGVCFLADKWFASAPSNATDHLSSGSSRASSVSAARPPKSRPPETITFPPILAPVPSQAPGESALSWAWRLSPSQVAAAALGWHGELDRPTRLALAGRWAEEAPADAARWAFAANDPLARDEALAAVLTEWAGRDATGAEDFLLALSPADSRWDAARAAFAEARGWLDPELTPLRVALIVNEKQREDTTLLLLELLEP